jgi:hypothetical protein
MFPNLDFGYVVAIVAAFVRPVIDNRTRQYLLRTLHRKTVLNH